MASGTPNPLKKYINHFAHNVAKTIPKKSNIPYLEYNLISLGSTALNCRQLN